MSQDGQSAAQPVVPCSFELDPALKRILDPAHPFHTALTKALASRLTELMKTLGIPGQPSIELHALEEAVPQFMNVQVNGQVCLYQVYVHRRVYSYVKASIVELQAEYDVIWAWLRDLAQEIAASTEHDALDSHPLVEFLAYAGLEIVKIQPAVLLGLGQVEAIQHLLPLPASPSQNGVEAATKDEWPQAEWLRAVFTKLVQQNISLADTDAIGSTLVTMRNNAQDEIIEELISKLSADVLEIHLPQDLLRTFTTAYARYSHGHLRNVRQTMMQSLGLSLPEMRFILNEDMKPGSFACKINSLSMLPWMVIPEDALEYIEQLLLLNVRENKKCFVHRRAVEQWLAQYKQPSPLLFRLAVSGLSIYRVTQVLRILVGEEVSIRNLLLILELLLNYRYIVTNPALPLTFQEVFPVPPDEEQAQRDQPVYLASFVRIGLKRAISYKYAGDQRQLYSYFFQGEPVVEQAISIFHDYDSREQPNPPGTQAVVITSIGVRPAIQELINANMLPYIPALAYQELIPGLHIQLVERVVTDSSDEPAASKPQENA